MEKCKTIVFSIPFFSNHCNWSCKAQEYLVNMEGQEEGKVTSEGRYFHYKTKLAGLSLLHVKILASCN